MFDKLFLSNFIWLAIIRVGRIAAPLVLIPILSKTFGNDKLGIYLLFLSVANWLALVVDYGFVFSATKEVASKRDDIHTLRKILSEVTSAKILLILCLFLVSFPILVLFKNLWLVIVLGSISGIITGLVPLWYFQGTERSKLPAVCDLIFYLLLVPVALLASKYDLSVYFVVFIYIVLRVIVLLYTTIVVMKELNISSIHISFKGAFNALKLGSGMAFFRLSTTMYITLNGIIVGLILSPLSLVIFSIPEKIARGIVALLSPLSQAIFPRLSYLVEKTNNSNNHFVNSMFISIFFGLSLSVGLFFLSPYLVSLFLSDNQNEASQVLKYFSVLPVLVSISNSFGLQYLVVMGYEKVFNKIIFSAAFMNLLMIYPLINFFEVQGAVYSVLITESYVSTMMFIAFIMTRGRGKC
ncbi:oligosaccharide flippase family protein [Vibrio alginolyticus]|uniref:oligosaccharide flippase family protein n=1 Tax=Vibrio alginolyticus TaxID=663 RepID=UPI003754D58A